MTATASSATPATPSTTDSFTAAALLGTAVAARLGHPGPAATKSDATKSDATKSGFPVPGATKSGVPVPGATKSSATKSGVPASDADTSEVAHALRFLTVSGLLSDGESTGFEEYVTHGKSSAAESASGILTVASVLGVLVREEVPVALFRHAVDAAVVGFLHGGRDAATSCCAIAAIQVLATKS